MLYRCKNWTISLLRDGSGSALFNGKIFYDDKKYNISTGKVEKSAMKKSLVNNSSFLFYVNYKNTLVRLDTNGNKVSLEKNVDYVIGTNSANTVLYIKNGDLYRKTKTEKAVLVISKKEMITNLIKISYNKTDKEISKVDFDKSSLNYYGTGVLSVGLDCKPAPHDYHVYSAISLSSNGKDVNILNEDGTLYYSFDIYNKKVHYTLYGCDYGYSFM